MLKKIRLIKSLLFVGAGLKRTGSAQGRIQGGGEGGGRTPTPQPGWGGGG